MSELRADTITGSDGSSPVTLTKQEAAKAWFTYEQPANNLRNSLNTSSITDTATGRFSYNATSAFADTYSSFVSQGGNTLRESASTGGGVASNFTGRTTTVVHHNNITAGGSNADYTSCGAGFGDLA